MKLIFYLLVLVSVDSEYVACREGPDNMTSTNPCTDKNHIFLAPGVLTAGGSSRACVSRFSAEGPARMLVTLLTEDRQVATAARELPSGDGGCIDISVPQLPNTKADLIINIRYLEAGCTWERRLPVRVAGARVLLVHAERARYRPGDTLRVRALVLKADLTPAHGAIDEMWLEGPRGAWEGVRAAQWRRVRTRLGVAQVQHELDELAPPGRWTVRARLGDGSQGAAVFWVGNYELPPFQLSVRHAPRVLRSSDRLVWTVCVRYPWTEAVEGMLVIRIRGAGGITPSDGGGGIRTAVRLRAPRACHRHAAAARRIGLDGANPPDVVVADFSFQEDGTRIWQNTTVVSQVVNQAVSLEFLTKHRAVVSLGLPYKLKVKATRWDEKPASNERVRVCRSPASRAAEPTQLAPSVTDGACNDAVTDASGVARVMFSADNDGSAFYRFQASLLNDTSILAAPLFLPVQRKGTVHAALGPLRADSYAARTFVPLYLNARNVSTAITVHFVVITRGGIIYRWGATTQCPIANSANQIQTAPRNGPCNANLPILDANPINAANTVTLDINASDALLDRQMLRVMLPIKVTHQMCPDSHLIAYFYYSGELVSASKHFEMEECFANKVEATWQSRQTPPGSTTMLHLSTPGPALCALTALDTAAKWVQPGDGVKDLLMSGLRRLIEGHRNLTEYDAAAECFLTADPPDLPTSSLELTASWLAAAGVRMLGGDSPRNRQCQVSSPSPLLADEVAMPRSDFSEAWLWRLVAVGANGSAVVSARVPDSITRFEATAICTSRTGLALSPPAVLQVFREFFIHADSPRRLRSGDTTIIRYRLFNYLYESISVQIQILTDPHLEGPMDYVESACIAARSSIARRVELRAKIPGNARVSVRAKSVSDGGCVNATRSRNGVSDEVIIQMIVDPEGVPIQDQKSMLLCGKGSTEASSSEISWTWPAVQAVPGTESLTVWVAGDIAGPLLADADDLVMLPRGCGEQNMARLATNLLAFKQLDPRSTLAITAREHVARGFTRQLQYIHPSGGFSAFGASDATASTWLTAFAVRYMRRAHQFLTPGLPAPPALEQAEQWLLKQQMENGCFRNEGQVFHRELRGGLNEEGEIASVALTAYVITSLVESSILPSRVLRNTLSCLRALAPLKTKSPTRVYAHALLAYAFMRLRRYEDEIRSSNEASLWEKKGVRREIEGLVQDEEMRELIELLKMARRSGEFVWWETGSLSTSIEATGYALLALSGCPAELRDSSCGQDARAAIRWLSTQRNAAGGFVATQDTLIALEALISWSSVQPSSPTTLNVTARSNGSVKIINLHPGVRVPDVMNMGAGDQISVNVEGTGCALVQTTRFYNAYPSDLAENKLLSVRISVHTDGAFNCDVNGTSCFCAAVVETCVVWGGAFPEMALLEVALPGGFGADAPLLYSQLQKANTLLRRIEVSPNSGRATLYLGTRDGSDTLGHGGHECYNLHAVGPRAKTKPAYAKVMDYYRPAVNDTQMYTIPEDCPQRISHESNQYLASDNLFNKAKSLYNSGEVVITHEFSFDDIPDGIPLEDPMYDNLTQDNISNIDENDKIQEIIAKINESNDFIAIKTTKVNIETNKLDNLNQVIKNQEILKNIDSKERDEDDTRNIKAIPTLKLADFNEEELLSMREGKAKEVIFQPENKILHKITDSKTDSDNEIIRSETEHHKHSIEIRDETNRETGTVRENTNDPEKKVDNPNLSSFHVIESDKDLEVPAGIEGPVPSFILPPPNYSRSYIPAPRIPYSGAYGTPWRSRPGSDTSTYFRTLTSQGSYFYQPVRENVFPRNRFRRHSSIKA